MKHSKAVICLTTHDRIDCARINLEIIKLNYKHPFPVVHACSGSAYTKYLEDRFIACEPRPLKEGALNLLQESVREAIHNYSADYIIHLESDTWILDESIILNLIDKMDKNPQLMLCTSLWDTDILDRAKPRKTGALLRIKKICASLFRPLGIPCCIRSRKTLATQFFIMRATPGMFKLIQEIDPSEEDLLESCFYKWFFKFYRKHNLLLLKEREPVHPGNRYILEALTLYSQHWPATGTANDQRDSSDVLYIPPNMEGKKETLLRYPLINNGANIQKLLQAIDFGYYNPGASRC